VVEGKVESGCGRQMGLEALPCTHFVTSLALPPLMHSAPSTHGVILLRPLAFLITLCSSNAPTLTHPLSLA